MTVAVHRVVGGARPVGIPGLAAQILRSAAAVPANLAEGCGRRTTAEFARFLDIALGSVIELDYHLLLARDIGVIRDDAHIQLEAELTSVRRLMIALLGAVRMRDAGVGGE